MTFPDTQIEPASWHDIDGWRTDDHAAAFATFVQSCRAVVRGQRTARDARPMFGPLRDICTHALKTKPKDGAAAREFFEEHFRPVRIAKLGERDGFLTGYYEPQVDGSRTATEEYGIPIYRKPSNLVAAGRSRMRPGAFPNKGRVGRLVGRRKIVPYHDRGEIEDGVLSGRNLEIGFLRSAVDLFFIQIQGSARVKLADGKSLRVNYAAHNGHPYTPVGRILIDRGIVPREEMSMDRIREWMAANPEEAKELRRKNQSYVFFREVELPDHEEPRGAQGVPLTSGRSIAVDQALHVYGTPFFIEADLPVQSARSVDKFRRLMVAQDTGSAIVGPARADIYLGGGGEAGRVAGRIRHPGRFVMLLPRALDPVAAGARMPLPPVRPGTEKVASGESAKESVKSRTRSKRATRPRHR